MLSLYIFLYNKNICCHYTSSCIRKKYTFMYDKNIYCHYMSSYIRRHKYCYYTSSCIMRNTLSCIIKIFVVVVYSLI